MKTGILFFFIGTIFTGSLFQFDINLPSFHATQALMKTNELLKQKDKILKTKKAVNKQRKKLPNKVGKKAIKKLTVSYIPFVGPVIALTFIIEDYCSDLEDIVELSNILDDKQVKFNFKECVLDVKRKIRD